MSNRELRSLNVDGNTTVQSRTRSGRATDHDMSKLEDEIANLKAQLAQSREQFLEKEEEAERLATELREAKAETVEAQETAASEAARADSLQQELERQRMSGEIDKFRALEDVRRDHQAVLVREAELRVAEQVRMDAWIRDLKDSHHSEKEHLLKRIETLEKKSTAATGGADVRDVDGALPSDGSDSEKESGRVSPPASDAPAVSVSLPTVAAPSPSVSAPSPSVSAAPVAPVSSPAVTTPVSVVTSPSSGAPTTHISAPSAASTTGTVTTSVSSVTPIMTPIVTGTPTGLSPAASVFVPAVGATSVSTTPTSVVSLSGGIPTPVSGVSAVVTPASGEPATGTVPSPGSTSSIMETFTRLLKTQTDVMAAQVKAVTLQNLPSLPPYTGEGRDATDDGFDRWLQRFRERAAFANWSAED